MAPTQPAAAYSTASPREQPEPVLTIPLPPHHPPPPPLVVTPVHVRTLAALLTHHPNPHFVNYLTTGFQFGFSTGHSGLQAAHRAPNLQSALAHPQVITDYLQQEGVAGHTAGPFSTPPLPNFIVSPLGAVPKKRSGKWRLIMHLSHPPGHSINDGIDIADFPLRYSTVYDAMDSVMHLGRHALMAKLDVKSAFRLCPVRPSEHHLLGMQWQGRFYFDRVLPFGLRSAPFIFNGLAEAVEWLARDRGVGHVHHYLDDFFLAGAPSTDECSQHLATVTSLCGALGIPLAEDKLAGPTTELEYLGILLDSAELEARLPPDKLHDIKSSLHQWTDRSQCSKRDLLSLIGTLSFAAKVVPAGRTFLRRMIDLSTTAPRLLSTITLNEGLRLDIHWWQAFTTPWSGRSFFLLPNWTPAPDLDLYTDSSGSIGFGAYWCGEWFNGHWPPELAERSIQFKELYPIVLAASVWGHRWATLRVRFLCDNQAVVHCIVSGSSHCPHMMHLLRNLFLFAARFNFTVSALHLPGTHNIIADSLSRFHMQVFRAHAPAAAPLPTPLPPCLPLEAI